MVRNGLGLPRPLSLPSLTTAWSYTYQQCLSPLRVNTQTPLAGLEKGEDETRWNASEIQYRGGNICATIPESITESKTKRKGTGLPRRGLRKHTMGSRVRSR